MANRYVTKLEHEVFIDFLPYEWRSGTSDGLFLPIYPPRGMRSSTLLRGLINFCNKYVSSLWLMLSPWIICTLTLPPLLASLVPRNFRRYHKPTIYLPQNSHVPTYHGISIAIPRYIAMQLPSSSYTWFEHSLSYCFAWSCSWHCIRGKATVHNSFIHVTLHSLHTLIHRQRHSHRVIFCSKYRVIIVEL